LLQEQPVYFFPKTESDCLTHCIVSILRDMNRSFMTLHPNRAGKQQTNNQSMDWLKSFSG